MVHFNWTQLIPGVSHETIHVSTAIASFAFLSAIAVFARISLGSGQVAVTPAGRFSVKGVIEIIVEFIVGLTDMVVGEHGRKYVPFFASIFFYIWVNNLMGLIPGMTPATDNINTTLALGLFSFIMYNFYGLKENGLSYIKHFFGPMMPNIVLIAVIMPLMFLIEMISHGIRPLTLGLRLQGNMMADHTVLSVFLDQFPWVVPAIFYGMGIFVSSMQAFVFTVLTMIYISLSIAHDH